MKVSKELAMNLTRLVVVAFLLTVAVGVSHAQQASRKLEISFNDGLVTLVAENVTLREILAEWARKGGSRITNADKITGAAVFPMEFRNEPEAAVLRALLRDLPGYGASMRIAPSPNASVVEAVFIHATRTITTSGSSGASAVPPPATRMNFQEPPQPQAAPRMIQGSPDDEIPPVRPIVGDGPPTTPNTPPAGQPTPNSNLRVGPGGVVTSTIPGVIIPVQPGTTAPGAKPPTTGRSGGGGGR